MKIYKRDISKITISDVQGLDPISVFIEDHIKGQGQITIICYGKAWTSFWGAMGDCTMSEFFRSGDEHYLAKNLSNVKPEIYDIDAIRIEAEKKEIEYFRDDPWNDYEFMGQLFGPDMADWHDRLPKKENYEYRYLCRIIKTVQQALGELNK